MKGPFVVVVKMCLIPPSEHVWTKSAVSTHFVSTVSVGVGLFWYNKPVTIH